MPFPLHWHTEPLLLICLLFFAWLHALAIGPLRKKLAPEGTSYPLRDACFFYSAILITYLAVGSPLDQIGEDFLFSAHMVQHMLLIYVAPPLFLCGTPSWAIDALLTSQLSQRITRFFAHPAAAGFLFTFLYTAWHIPSLYELALQNKTAHVLEHWMMFLPALFMWWSLLTQSKIVPRSPYGVRMLYTFMLMVGQLPVFGFLTLSEAVLYPTYEFAPRIVDLSPLQDQILGGVIMKVTNMVVSMSILCVSFYQWYQQDLRETSET